MELLLSRIGNLVMKDVEKTNVLNVYFTSLFTGEQTGLQKSQESETTG